MVIENAQSSTEQDIRHDLGGLPSRSQLRLRRAPWTISAFSADALMASPSWKSMARTALLSRRVLKRPFGSFSWAPFGNVSLTAFLRVSPMQTMPSWDQTGTPSGREGFFHFTSSITARSAPLIRARSWPSLSPLQPLVFRTMASICWDADAPFMNSSIAHPSPDSDEDSLGVGAASSAGSVDSLGQGHDDSLRPAHVGHAPDVLILTDAADQAVAVRSQPVDNRLEVVHFEANVAQPQLVRYGAGRALRMVRPYCRLQLQAGPGAS